MSLRSIAAMILRGAAYVVDGGIFPQVQIGTAKDAAEDAEHMQPFGLATWMPPGIDTDGLVAHVGACPDHPVVFLVSSRTLRPIDLASGDTVLYDSRGNQVRLTVAGVDLGGIGGAAVGRVGDGVSVTIPVGTVCIGIGPGPVAIMNPAPITLTGTITSGSAVTRST